MILGAPAVLLHYAFGFRVRMSVSTLERRILWASFIALVLANWAYLIWAEV